MRVPVYSRLNESAAAKLREGSMLTCCSLGKSTRRFCTSTSRASVAIFRSQLLILLLAATVLQARDRFPGSVRTRCEERAGERSWFDFLHHQQGDKISSQEDAEYAAYSTALLSLSTDLPQPSQIWRATAAIRMTMSQVRRPRGA